jgi:hypothetical protein
MDGYGRGRAALGVGDARCRDGVSAGKSRSDVESGGCDGAAGGVPQTHRVHRPSHTRIVGTCNARSELLLCAGLERGRRRRQLNADWPRRAGGWRG